MLFRLLHCRSIILGPLRGRREHCVRSTRSDTYSNTVALASQQSPCFLATSESATSVLSSILASKRQAGDCICLRGEVGAGKSAFSRAYIRAVEEDDTVPVPSPTYLLQNIYEYNDGPSIYHYDLYRLNGQDELQRLDLQTSLGKAVNLIEWPDRLEGLAPQERLDLEIKVLAPEVQARGAEQLSELLREADKSGDECSEDDEAGEFSDCRAASSHPRAVGATESRCFDINYCRTTGLAAASKHQQLPLAPFTPQLLSRAPRQS